MGSSLRLGHRAWLLKVAFVLGMFVAAGIAVGVVAGADQPAISSDRSEYAPGEEVVLSGDGWLAGEVVELVVDDDQGDAWTYETDLAAGEDGTILDSFVLPELAGEFTVSAIAPSGTASASFTVTAPSEPEPAPNPACAATGDETLGADKPGYLPGGRALLTGSGYEPSCDLVLRITLPDGSVATETVTTDTGGGIGHVWPLPSPAVPGEYLAETVDAGDAVLASATFDGMEPTAGTPTIWTDRDDYAPGEVFELRGAGWLPGEAIQVVVDDDDGDTWLHTADVVAGADGMFTHEFQLPDWFVAVYTVTATGALSGEATTSFTDSMTFGGCPAGAAPIVVTIAIDEFSAAGGTGCSLREATRAANLDGAADTIVLTAATTYTLTRTGTGNDDTSTGDLDVLNPLTITGNGATIEAHTTSGSGIDRVFHVLNGSLTVSNATIRHGRVGSGGGGGILTNGRPLTLSNATVTSNQTTGGNDGAGIHSAGGTVVVDDSTLSGNAATGSGAEGGGLYSSGGSWTITDSTINGNTAASNAAGIWTSGTGTLTNVTLTENTSSGIAGGIRVDSSTTTITNATISHNTAASGTGGGVARTSGTVNLRNTIVANNVVGVNLHANCSTNDASQLVNVGGNLDSGATCLFAALNGSQSAANPGLGSLAANGGPTRTRSIGSGSPAVDRSIAGAPANDQRGLGRTDGPDVDATAQADVGAYEFQAPTNTAPSVAYVSPAASANEGQTVTYNFQITDPDAGDTFSFVSSYPKCGTGGSLVASSESINSGAKTGTFQCSFPDGAASPTVEVRVKDAANAESNTASQPVSVSNVPPSIAISGAASVSEGSTYTLTLGAVSDPGPDVVTSYVVHWGDGDTDTYGTAGAKTHTYADGLVTRSVTVDLVDEDGTHPDRANAHSVQVDNVAPTIAISGSGSATEGSPYSLTLGAVTDPGSDTITSYVVHWGDGATDTYGSAGAQTHTYADGPATRAVTVDLVDEDGTHPDRANTHSVVVANVSPAVTAPANQTADEGTSETFDLGSFTDPGDDGPWQVTVDWGDGTTDSVFSEAAAGAIADKAHTYADDGPFTVTVTVAEDAGAGADSSATFQVTVANVAPDVTAPAGQSASEGTPATFALGSFTDPGDDDPWKVTVDWGDGSADTVSTEPAPGAIAAAAHTYADDGTYTVTVTVEEENGAGASGSDTFQVSVANVMPSVTPPADQAASEGTAATFDLGSFGDPGDDDPWQVTVDWGDGSADTVFTETSPGPIADKSHTYADNGPYTVTITVKEDSGTGVGGSATFAVAVANVAPVVTAPAAQNADEATSKSFALGSFTDPGDDDPWQITVDWGDGSADTVFTEASAGPIAAQSHTYGDDGLFTITVTVAEESGTGASGMATFQVTVANLPPDITAVTAESPIDEGDASTVAVTATDPAGANDPLSYHFDCDGNGTFEVGPQAGSSHDCSFADNGMFTVNVRVTDGDGGADTGSDTVQVANVAPVVTAPANQAASEGTDGSFALGSFADPGDDDPWEITVDWGDGSTDTVFTEASPGAIAAKSHTFADDGTFTVTVTVDEDGGAGVHGTETFQVVVANVPPEVTAPADQSASEGTSASFALGSFTDPGDDDPWQITVDWGDGSADTVFTETGPGPIAGKSHTYADDGLYTVTVTVDEDNGAGAADAATFGVNVSNVAPNVTPPAGQTASEGTSKTFDLGSFADPGDDDPWEVTVDWGDGSADTVFTEATTGAITDKAHTYVDDGAYTVTVTVDEENGAGASGTATFQVTVANVAPMVAKPTFQPSSVGCQTSVTLTGISFSDPGVDDDPWTVDIDWGDLSPHTTYATSTQGAQPDQTHTYASSGGFTATVSVTDDHATGSNTSTAPVTVYRYSVEFRPPVEGSSTGHVIDNRMKNGRVVPVKVRILDLCAGAELTDPNAAVRVAVTKASGTPGVDDPVAEYADAGASSDGTNLFRWSTEHWIYNLDSKALGFVVGNRYRVDVYVNGVLATVATWAILDPYK